MLANGITLGYATTAGGPYTVLETLKKVPDLGSDPEMVENTALNAKNKQYEIGVGDAGEFEYTFKYEDNLANSETRKILELCDAGKTVHWEETLTDGTKFTFSGTPSSKIVGGELNSPLELVVRIGIDSDFDRTDPVGA